MHQKLKIISLLLFFSSLSANCNSDRWYAEIKLGYFYPNDSILREIFDNGGFSLRGEADYEFWSPLALWLDAGWWGKSGTAIGGTEKTNINVGTFTLGLKGFWHFHKMASFYLGAGPRVFLMKNYNDSPFVQEDVYKTRIGGGFIGGFLVFLGECSGTYFDLFLDYSLRNIKAHNHTASQSHDINIDGLTAGLGLGHRF